MDDIKFSDNFSDLSRESGVNAGFQFEFYCERCSDRWRTPFVSYRSGQATSWMEKATRAVGGLIGTVGDAVGDMAQAGWRKARDDAFRQAVESAKEHFHRCARCYQYVCDKCWNPGAGLCQNCSPSVEAEVESAKVWGAIKSATEKAIQEGARLAEKIDIRAKRQLTCPKCGQAAGGGKFCANCGAKLATDLECPSCKATVAVGAKFCPECGHNLQG